MVGLRIHIILSLLASLGHYGFQLLGARYLGQSLFAEYTGLIAELGILLALATWANFWMILRADEEKLFLRFFVVSQALGLVCFGLFLHRKEYHFIASAIIFGAVAHSMLAGRLIAKLNYLLAGLVNALSGLTKIIVLIAFFSHQTTVSNLFVAIYLSYVVASLLVFFPVPKSTVSIAGGNAGPGAAILSFNTQFFPIYDVVWVDLFHSSLMSIVAPLGFITRGVFFVQLILSQWALPQKDATQKYYQRWRRMVLLLSVPVSVIGAFILKELMESFLSWSDSPPTFLFVLAGIGAWAAALIYTRVQWLVVEGKVLQAFIFSSLGLSVWVVTGLVSDRAEAVYVAMIIMGVFNFFIPGGDKENV